MDVRPSSGEQLREDAADPRSPVQILFPQFASFGDLARDIGRDDPTPIDKIVEAERKAFNPSPRPSTLIRCSLISSGHPHDCT